MRPIPLAEAAVQLGVSEETVRQYIRSGALQAFKSEEGQWLVYRLGNLDADEEQTTCHFGPAADRVATLQNHVACLEREIRDLKTEIRRRDRIIASLESRAHTSKNQASGVR